MANRQIGIFSCDDCGGKHRMVVDTLSHVVFSLDKCHGTPEARIAVRTRKVRNSVAELAQEAMGTIAQAAGPLCQEEPPLGEILAHFEVARGRLRTAIEILESCLNEEEEPA